MHMKCAPPRLPGRGVSYPRCAHLANDEIEEGQVDGTRAQEVGQALDSRFSEVGIGVVRTEAPLGRQPAGSLVITLIFVER